MARNRNKKEKRGVLYFNKSYSHSNRLCVSINSLRKHDPDLPVTILHVGTDDNCPKCLKEAAKIYNCNLLITPDEGYRALSDKIRTLKMAPYEECVFLDADTIMCESLIPFFEMLGDKSFVLVNFDGWKTDYKRIKKRIVRFRGIMDDAVIDEAISGYPAVNVGTFAFRTDASFLDKWFDYTERGMKKRIFIPDEITAQIFLPFMSCNIAGPEWGVSVRYGKREGAKIIHYHGNKHKSKYAMCDEWWDWYWKTLKDGVSLDEHIGKKSIVTAVNDKFLSKFEKNYETWLPALKKDKSPLFIIRDDTLKDKDFEFAKGATIIETPNRNENPRHRMIESLVTLPPAFVQSDFWVKLDADCALEPNTKLFSSKKWQSFDMVSHKWGYTKPGHWLVDLDNWAADKVGKRLFKEEDYKKMLEQKRYGHPRIQSFACLHNTQFTREAIAYLEGGMPPIPSHDTFYWFMAELLGKKISRQNLKGWGFKHPSR